MQEKIKKLDYPEAQAKLIKLSYEYAAPTAIIAGSIQSLECNVHLGATG